MHATNCRGIVLSWGAYFPGIRGGHEDVNYHSRDYLVGIFEQLGYRFRTDLTREHMSGRPGTRPHHPWFGHNMVGVLERWNPIVDGACSGVATAGGGSVLPRLGEVVSPFGFIGQ